MAPKRLVGPVLAILLLAAIGAGIGQSNTSLRQDERAAIEAQAPAEREFRERDFLKATS